MKHFREYWVTYCVMILSALFFILIYGVKVLDVTYTDWLLCGGDLSQHYLGWKFFRNAPWQWYIGMMNNIAYPYSESIIFTDSIPLFAVIFKVFQSLLPGSFQYFGLWGLLCFVLQGCFASLILRRYLYGSRQKELQAMIGSLFFVLAPILIRRMYWHTSLGGQWLLLLAIWIFIEHDRWSGEFSKMVGIWGFVGFLCAAIHLYFIPMCGVILLGFLIVDWLKNKKILRFFAPMLAYGACGFVTIWLLGGLYSGMDDGAPGLGYYSFNLDGFYNPQEWSALFSDIKNYADGQYEGFAYLGFGVLLLCVIAMIALAAYLFSERLYRWRQIRGYCTRHQNLMVGVLMGLILVVMAASPEVSFGNRLLFRIPITHGIEEIWAILRSSGRLIWPAVYMLMIFVIYMAVRGLTYLGNRCTGMITENRTQIMITILLIFCLGIQIYDISPQLANKHREFANEQIYFSELESPFWEQAVSARQIRHIVFADKNHMNQEQLYSFAEFASDHDITINDFYFARALTYPIEAVAQDFMKHPNQNTLYIFTEQAREQSKAYDFIYYEEDGFIIGVTDAFSF